MSLYGHSPDRSLNHGIEECSYSHRTGVPRIMGGASYQKSQESSSIRRSERRGARRSRASVGGCQSFPQVSTQPKELVAWVRVGFCTMGWVVHRIDVDARKRIRDYVENYRRVVGHRPANEGGDLFAIPTTSVPGIGKEKSPTASTPGMNSRITRRFNRPWGLRSL
jgi:hypothetical protein